MSQNRGNDKPSWPYELKRQFDMQFVRGTTSLSTRQRGDSDRFDVVHTGTPVVDESRSDDPVIQNKNSNDSCYLLFISGTSATKRGEMS